MTLSGIAGQGVFFIVFAILARILDKADFGLAAYAAVFSGFFGVFLRLGYGDALIQLKNMEPAHVATAYWTSAVAGVVLGLGCALAAYPIGLVLAKPELIPIVQWMSLSCVFIGIRTIPTALLSRELRFGSLGGATLFANALGGALGVVMAMNDWGVWSLVAQRLAIEGILSLAVSCAARYAPTLEFEMARLRELTSFSNHVFKTNLLQYADEYIDQFLVGWWMGDVKLGGYSVARRLIRMLTTVTLGSFRPVAFSAFARLQHDRNRAAEAVYKSTGVVVLLAYPVFFGVAAFAGDLIELLFTDKWSNVAPICQAFCGLALYSSSMAAYYGACMGMGHPEYVTRQRTIAVLVSFGLFFLLAPYGLVAVATGYAVKAYVQHPYQMWLFRKATGISFKRFYGTLLAPAVSSTVAVALAVVVVGQLPPAASLLTRLLVASIVLTSLHVTFVCWLMPDRARAIMALIRRPMSAPGQVLK